MILKSDRGDKPNCNSAEEVSPQAEVAPSLSGREIILAWFRGSYEPTFHRGDRVYSAKYGRVVGRAEAVCGAPFGLVELLKRAADAPQRGGAVDDAGIPGFFRAWAGSAWAEMLRSLPAEEDAAEIADSAEREFRDKVSAGLHSLVSMGRKPADGDARGQAAVERRSLLDWCVMWAKPGRWQDVRSMRLWTRKEPATGGGERVAIALRADLWSQIKYAPLAGINQNRFNRLAVAYGMGEDRKNQKVNGERATVLTADFVASLLRRPADDADSEAEGDGGDRDCPLPLSA